MESKSEISLDFTNNPDLSEAFSRKDVGDQFSVTIRATLKTKDQNGVKGVIKEIEMEESDDKEPVKPSGDEAASVSVMPLMMGDDEK